MLRNDKKGAILTLNKYSEAKPRSQRPCKSKGRDQLTDAAFFSLQKTKWFSC